MSSKTDFSGMQKLKVEEIEKILQQYLPKQQGYQKFGGRKKTAPYVDAGNISFV